MKRDRRDSEQGKGAATAASATDQRAGPWREALIELLDLKNLISEDPDNIRIDRCPASGRGEAHGEHGAGEWVAWDSEYPDEGALSLKGLITGLLVGRTRDAVQADAEEVVGGIDDALAQRVARQTVEIHELKADRDEWRTQHEHLLAIYHAVTGTTSVDRKGTAEGAYRPTPSPKASP